MTRVLHVVSTLGTYGAEQFVMQLSRRSAAPDRETAVLTIFSPAPAIAQEQAALGIPLFDMARGPRFDPLLLVRMTAAMRRWRPDIVHAHTLYGSYWGRAAALAAGVPAIVYTKHDNVPETRRPYRAANAVLHPRTDRFVAFGPEHRARYAATDGISLDRIAVIPNGIVPPPRREQRAAVRAQLGFASDAFVVILVARLDPLKNHALAIRAVAACTPEIRDTVLLAFAGDGDERDRLAALASDLGVAERVRFLGFRTDVADVMAAADACLSTSFTEAMPMTMLEAMFAELPILSVPWRGSHEVLGEGAYGTILADYEPETLAAAFASAIRDPEAGLQRARAARAHAAQVHDIERTAAAYDALYATLLAQKRNA